MEIYNPARAFSFPASGHDGNLQSGARVFLPGKWPRRKSGIRYLVLKNVYWKTFFNNKIIMFHWENISFHWEIISFSLRKHQFSLRKRPVARPQTTACGRPQVNPQAVVLCVFVFRIRTSKSCIPTNSKWRRLLEQHRILKVMTVMHIFYIFQKCMNDMHEEYAICRYETHCLRFLKNVWWRWRRFFSIFECLKIFCHSFNETLLKIMFLTRKT